MTVPLVCQAHGLPAPVAELQFAAPRRWRFDWAWPDRHLALEVQGGNWRGGRHTRPAGLRREYEKLNAAAVAGWRVVYCEPDDVQSGAIAGVLRAALS